MRAVLQRVSSASVVIHSNTVAEIQTGILVLLGISKGDEMLDMDWLLDKVCTVRIFEDEEGKMNKSIQDVDGEVLVVSQFTLFGNLKKGTRPSFNNSAPPDIAKSMYEDFVEKLKIRLNKEIPTGQFAADMKVSLTNDGPVTIILDSKDKKF